jgi:hypothetical protein
MIKNIVSRLTMVKTGKSFNDHVVSKPVYYWTDYYFDQYLASSRWGFRVKIDRNDNII